MTPGISLLALLHAVAAILLLMAGLESWEIMIMTVCLAVLMSGVLGSAVFVGVVKNPISAGNIEDAVNRLRINTAPASAVFYTILAVASSSALIGTVMGVTAVISAWTWFTRPAE
jgi:hypothetical protein